MSQKSALSKIADFDEKAILEINPEKPMSWEECVVNLSVLDMLRENVTFDKLCLPKCFYTYSNPEVQSEEGGVVLRDELVRSISENVVGEDFSSYLLVNQALYQCVMGKQKVILGEMPEILYRQVVAGNFTVEELKDIYKFIGEQLKRLIFPISFREGAYNFLPQIFQTPKDLYMTALLKESFQASLQTVSFIGRHHINPIKHYWQPPPNGINFTQATEIPIRKKNETDEDLIEKQALLDSLLEKRAWNKSYIHNPFPYLTNDITKVEQQVLKSWIECFNFHYLKFERFKRGFGGDRAIPRFGEREFEIMENRRVEDVGFLEEQEREFGRILDEGFGEGSRGFFLKGGEERKGIE